jgi:hypothetical protein
VSLAIYINGVTHELFRAAGSELTRQFIDPA